MSKGLIDEYEYNIKYLFCEHPNLIKKYEGLLKTERTREVKLIERYLKSINIDSKQNNP